MGRNNLYYDQIRSGSAVLHTANYTAVEDDAWKLLVFNRASSPSTTLTFTLPNPPPSPLWRVSIVNIGADSVSINPNGLSLNGSSGSGTATTGQGLVIYTDGSQYYAETGGGGTGGGGGGGSVGPGCSSYNAAGQTLNAGVSTALTFDTNEWDTGGIHSTSVNPTRFTAPSAGYYLCILSVVSSANNNTFELFFRKNGVALTATAASEATASTVASSAACLTQILKLNANDYVEGWAFCAQLVNTVANDSIMQVTKLSATL